MHFGNRHVKASSDAGGAKNCLPLFSDFLGFVPSLTVFWWFLLRKCDGILSGISVLTLEHFLVHFLFFFYMALFLFAYFVLYFLFLEHCVESFHCQFAIFSSAMKIRSLQKCTYQSLSWNMPFFPHVIINNGILEIYAWAAEILNLDNIYFKNLIPTRNRDSIFIFVRYVARAVIGLVILK